MTRIDIPLPNSYLYEISFIISTEDINYANHMGNERILVYANRFRSSFYKYLNLVEVDVTNGYGTIVANHTVKYVSEGFLNDTITCKIGITSLTTCSFDMILHFIKENHQTLAILRTGTVYYDYHERRIKEIPIDYLKAFKIN